MKGFIWTATRTAFYVFLASFALFVVLAIVNLRTLMIPGVIIVGLIPLSLVASIIFSVIHLTKYEKKKFPITVLIVMGAFIVIFIVYYFYISSVIIS